MTAPPATARLALCLLALAAGGPPAHARIGLSTQFIDVELEGLRPGGVYSLRELHGVPYALKNRGDAAIEVSVEVQSPRSPVPPYEPIPDPAWIEVTTSTQKIEPGALGLSDLLIRIPDDPALDGRHFQATLAARTLGEGLVGAGVDSRLRLSLGPGPGAAVSRALAAALRNLKYDLWPDAFSLSAAKTGAVYDGKKAEGRRFRLRNRADAELRLTFQAVPWAVGGEPLPAGVWETPQDLSWVRFEPATAVVAPSAVREVRLVLDGAPEAFRGRKAAFLVQLRFPDGGVVSQSHRVFITFPPGDSPRKKASPWMR